MTATYLLGMLISFFGNRRFSFSHTGSAKPAIIRFVLVNLVAYGVNFGILGIFSTHLGYNAVIVQIFAVGVVAVITFVSMRLWVFSGHRAS